MRKKKRPQEARPEAAQFGSGVRVSVVSAVHRSESSGHPAQRKIASWEPKKCVPRATLVRISKRCGNLPSPLCTGRARLAFLHEYRSPGPVDSLPAGPFVWVCLCSIAAVF
jgi:hypothetical protein